MQKRKLTQDDLDNNPDLAEQGLKAGDEIEIPEANELSNEATDDPADDDTGGSNPPPNKERP
jgi:hypothetical protein